VTTEQYALARAKAMRWKGDAVPQAFPLRRGIPDDLPGVATAIYIAELADHRCAYVGQTRQGVVARLSQHATDPARAGRWAYAWVIPVLDSVPNHELSRIEGRIGQLLKPLDSRRLPRPY
jgi:hypothetical protein